MTLAEAIPTWFANTAAGKRIVAEHGAKALAERRAHVAAIDAARAAEKEAAPALEAALAEAVARRVEAQASLDLASASEGAAHGALLNLHRGADYEVGIHERALRESAPPEIDDLVRELRTTLSATRRAHAANVEEVAGYSPGGKPVMEMTHSSRPSILARMDAIRQAIDQAEGLKLQAVDDVPAAIEQIRAGIPDGRTLVEVQHETD